MGEFKKRIEVVMYREYVSLPGAEAEEVLQIVEEAKKDFKSLVPENVWKGLFIGDPGVIMIDEFLKVYEKWFGGEAANPKKQQP